MGGGKGGGDGDTTIRYAPYLEEAHQEALTAFKDVFEAALGSSPYGAFSPIPVDDGFLGVHDDDPTIKWELRNFPSLWDMFGKFMAGVDVHKLWNQTYQDVVYSSEVNAAVTAHADLLQDEIDTNVMPRFLAGMRDINAIHSSSFIVGKSIIQQAHVKSVNDFAAKIRLRVAELNTQVWSKHLEWNHSVVQTYAEMQRLYIAAKLDTTREKSEMAAKDVMWDINLFEHTRAILGALGGGHPIKDPNEVSDVGRALGGALSGAAMGAQLGFGAPGAAVGGLLGLAGSLF